MVLRLKKELGQYPANLSEKNWANKLFKEHHLSCGSQREMPGGVHVHSQSRSSEAKKDKKGQ